MKLISVIHFPEFGGPQNQALRLAPLLDAEGIESLTVIPDGPASTRLSDGGLNVRRMPLGRVRAVLSPRTQLHTLFRLPLDIIGLVRLYRREEADVVQLNGLMNPHAAIAAKIAGVPVVWQILDTRTPSKLRSIMKPLLTRLSTVVMPVGYEVARMYPGVEQIGDRMVVFPALSDPHGLVVEEAMAAGLPVISSKAAGDISMRLPDGEAGYLMTRRML